MARDVAGLVTGMQLLEPGFPDIRLTGSLDTVGRLPVPADPVISDAIDRALAAAGLAAQPVALPGWADAWQAADEVLSAEAWRADRDLLAADPGGIGDVTAGRIAAGEAVTVEREHAARQVQVGWQRALDDVLAEVGVFALPTLVEFPPALDATSFRGGRWTLPINFAGLPALSIPVPTGGALPASLQLVGPAYSEDILLTIGKRIESAVQ
jgi:Asp-tRNA(Asn)/Glu-tRNA(Gln) amidotransferase A subunit family amidase